MSIYSRPKLTVGDDTASSRGENPAKQDNSSLLATHAARGTVDARQIETHTHFDVYQQGVQIKDLALSTSKHLCGSAPSVLLRASYCVLTARMASTGAKAFTRVSHSWKLFPFESTAPKVLMMGNGDEVYVKGRRKQGP